MSAYPPLAPSTSSPTFKNATHSSSATVQELYCAMNSSDVSNRSLFRLNSSSFVCRQLFYSSSEDFGSSNDAANATNATIISNGINTTTTRSGKFDYLAAPCMKELISLFSNANADLFQDYDLIVINIWEYGKASNTEFVTWWPIPQQWLNLGI
jgi:hypothetical protein